MKRISYLLLPVLLLAALAPFAPFTLSVAAVMGAAFTTVDVAVDGPGHCANGNPAVNCNIYNGKQYVWLNGGPVANQLGPSGKFFFAVLAPGGQPNANDGTPKNLSDNYDAYNNRTFTIANGKVSAYSGTHRFDRRFIRLSPYANTPNSGGVYILAICSLAHGYPVKAMDCKFDQFKVMNPATTTPPTTLPPPCVWVTADFTLVPSGASLQTPNAAMQGLTIASSGLAVHVERGKLPAAFYARPPTSTPTSTPTATPTGTLPATPTGTPTATPTPHGVPTGADINYGLDVRYGGGFYDEYGRTEIAPDNGLRYTFTFDQPIYGFKLHMLDFGDWNPSLARHHVVTLTALLEGGDTIKKELQYSTTPQANPTEMELAGDAYWAKPGATPGQPGNWEWQISSSEVSYKNGIRSVQIEMYPGADPNHAFDKLQACIKP